MVASTSATFTPGTSSTARAAVSASPLDVLLIPLSTSSAAACTARAWRTSSAAKWNPNVSTCHWNSSSSPYAERCRRSAESASPNSFSSRTRSLGSAYAPTLPFVSPWMRNCRVRQRRSAIAPSLRRYASFGKRSLKTRSASPRSRASRWSAAASDAGIASSGTVAAIESVRRCATAPRARSVWSA